MYEHKCDTHEVSSKVLELTDGRELCVMCGTDVSDERADEP